MSPNMNIFNSLFNDVSGLAGLHKGGVLPATPNQCLSIKPCVQQPPFTTNVKGGCERQSQQAKRHRQTHLFIGEMLKNKFQQNQLNEKSGS